MKSILAMVPVLAAGIAAAPANAVEEVLAAADIVPDSNNNAGIAKTIYELI